MTYSFEIVWVQHIEWVACILSNKQTNFGNTFQLQLYQKIMRGYVGNLANFLVKISQTESGSYWSHYCAKFIVLFYWEYLLLVWSIVSLFIFNLLILVSNFTCLKFIAELCVCMKVSLSFSGECILQEISKSYAAQSMTCYFISFLSL